MLSPNVKPSRLLGRKPLLLCGALLLVCGGAAALWFPSHALREEDRARAA